MAVQKHAPAKQGFMARMERTLNTPAALLLLGALMALLSVRNLYRGIFEEYWLGYVLALVFAFFTYGNFRMLAAKRQAGKE